MTTAALPARRHAEPPDIAGILCSRFIADTNEVLLGAGLLNDTTECSAVVKEAALAVIEAAVQWDGTMRVAVIQRLSEAELKSPGRKSS